MKITLKEIAPIYIKAIKEISRLNTEIEKLVKQGLDSSTQNINLRNENTELHCRLSQLELFSSIDKASGPDETVTGDYVPFYTMTPKAKGATREQFKSERWTDELLLEHGYMMRTYKLYRSN